MKKFEITEEQIKQAYDAACEDLKQRIKEWFPELYKKQSGWYKTSEFPNWMGYIDYENDKVYGFGALDGRWFESNKSEEYVGLGYELAPEKEVKERLIEEAKRRGFVYEAKTTVIEDKENCENRDTGKVGSMFNFINNNLYVSGYGQWCIFKDGQWAEIISTPEPDEYITVNNIKYKRCN